MSALAIQTISLACMQPASANYYKHYRHEQRKAAHQHMEASIDAAEGKYGKARMHQRKAQKDSYKAYLGW